MQQLSTKLAKLMEPIQPISHLSNSLSVVRHQIRSAEQTHWLEGVKAAELCIDKQQGALQFNYSKQREYERKIQAKREQLEFLTQKSAAPKRFSQITRYFFKSIDSELSPAEKGREIEKLQDAIDTFEYHRNRLKPLVRDAVMELEAALVERERIIQANPQSTELTYAEIQEFATPNALDAVMAKYIAARLSGIPETAAAALLDIEEDRLAGVLERVDQEKDRVRLAVEVRKKQLSSRQQNNGNSEKQFLN